ncbi:uncharacterized protein A4U43_C01F9770 [Asparagus officinalis]|uniref:Uncharacterized protein n=1 Tax=Asparagus officinalis TaxID=4686 RepID=A0A5P1FNF4_ASPOF|nr:uncharacterized protein A4U43_C01F9770 [Asparagus officinalis]
MYSSFGDVPPPGRCSTRTSAPRTSSPGPRSSAPTASGGDGGREPAVRPGPGEEPGDVERDGRGLREAGRREDARGLFEQMPIRTPLLRARWLGFAKAAVRRRAWRRSGDARPRVPPNEAALVSAASACAQLRSSDHGDFVYRYARERRSEMSVFWSR